MSRPLKIALKIGGTVLCVLILLWLGIAAFVTVNKKELLETVTAQLNNDINGKLTIESMEPALIQGFPGVSVSLKNVLLQDSLIDKHRHNLMEAKEIFVSLNVFALIGGNTVIQKLFIHDGKIYLFTDKAGNSNNTILTPGSDDKREGKRKQIKLVEFKDVSFIQENQQRNKYFNFDIRHLTAQIKYRSDGWKGSIRLNTEVNSLAFNTRRGSFIKNQLVEANLEMSYNQLSKVLEIPVQDISIGKEHFEIGGHFRSTEQTSDFKLSVAAPKIELKKVSSFLAKNIASKLDAYTLRKPFFAQAIIMGSLKSKGDPKILVSWRVKNNELSFSGETIRNCSFTGYFDNEFKKGKGFNDANSVIGFSDFKGTYFNIPFQADTVRIVNLRRPIFEGRFESNFALEKLNQVSGSKSFHFHNGYAKLNLFYRAPYNKSNSTEPFIYGTLGLSNATIAYHPRNLTFSGIKGLFRFRGQDLFLENLHAKTGSNTFVMQGSLLNFLNLYYTDPKKIKLDWHVKSPRINLSEFLAFLGRRKSSNSTNTNKKSATRLFNQLDKVLAEANVHLDLEADQLVYRRFSASKIHSSILLKQSEIELQDVSLNHAGGRLQIKGNIDQSRAVNRFNISTRIVNVDLPKLFYAFENFGQDAIAFQNLKGGFNSSTNISGLMRENGQIIPRSFNGSVSFEIKNGALLNFEPMQKIGNFAFPNRDFSNITFTRLRNTFDIKGSTIQIRPMYIESSVLNLYIEGIYGMPTGTDIALRIPLRNPKRDIGLSDSLKRKRFDNGIVINVRAQDDENGNVKFKLGKKDEEDDKEELVKEKEKTEKNRQKALRREARKEGRNAL
ncbi:AsmA-like C-terminal region-containing protein [Paradesertivirga mongoliensis]|uniref:AsmA-like C-terminal region-containing protein n=1 Tax=Paradesertivirga mongoliensis TaxID=2100740 RepID=A0ABW4ZI70_9SPHI|nr:AsmA-like C-terminal region-containing protein [Pedobacter mongoliensis]